jgi:hypothetical protein
MSSGCRYDVLSLKADNFLVAAFGVHRLLEYISRNALSMSFQLWIWVVCCCSWMYVDATIDTTPTSLFPDIPLARLRCVWALWRTNLDLSNFDRYDDYFRNESVVELAQAGEYQGVASIQEYVKFAFAGSSPYLLQGDTRQRRVSIQFLDYKDDICEFRMLLKFQSVLNPNTTAAPVFPFELVDMIRLYLHRNDRYFTRINVYYTNDFLRLFFDAALNSDATRQYVCEHVMAGPCWPQLNITNTTACINTLNALPTTEGSDHYIDGNSQGCRALHAAFASTNPTQHCAHLSFAPLPDPAGKIKCQTSHARSPTDLFTESDFTALRRFAIKHNIDPVLGHNCCRTNASTA